MPDTGHDSRRLLYATVLCDAEPRLTADDLAAALARTRPEAEVELVGQEQALVSHHDALTTDPQGRSVPLTTVLMWGERPAETLDVSQSWHADDAVRAAAQQAGWRVTLAEVLALSNPPATRLGAFAAVVAAVAELTDAVAVWCPQTVQLVPPDAVAAEPSLVGVNLRLFVTDEDDEAIVIDSLGLDVLGLPDVQIHCRDLDAADLAEHVHAIALTLLERGDVSDGDTVAGLADDDVWRLQHEDSLVPPGRLVLDVDPGDPYAAGTRHRG